MSDFYYDALSQDRADECERGVARFKAIIEFDENKAFSVLTTSKLAICLKDYTPEHLEKMIEVVKNHNFNNYMEAYLLQVIELEKTRRADKWEYLRIRTTYTSSYSGNDLSY